MTSRSPQHRALEDELVWHPPMWVWIAAILVWIWIISEIVQLIYRVPGLFE